MFVIRGFLTDGILECHVVVGVHGHCEIGRSGAPVIIGNRIGEVIYFRGLVEIERIIDDVCP